MIKVDNIDVWGFENAIRGMRNPMNSWSKSDSYFNGDPKYCEICEHRDDTCDKPCFKICMGYNDLDLMKRLFKSGVEHRTYARMIMVSFDVNAPLYWWKEADRYRFKEQISTSTMHKIHSNEFTLDDFSHEHLNDRGYMTLKNTICQLNADRNDFINTKNKEYWWQMIQLLPSSYNQKRTVMMSYETVFKIIKERKNHKLDEWNEFVEVLEQLPYVKEIME